MDRFQLGRLWKLMPEDKVFRGHIDYINNYCMQLLTERRKEPREALLQRNDMLSRIIVSKRVRASVHHSVLQEPPDLPASCVCACKAMSMTTDDCCVPAGGWR